MIEGKNRKTNDKKARKIRKYGQAKLKHSKKGTISCAIAGGILLVMLLLVVIAFNSKGTSGGLLGSAGLICAIFTWIGISTGYKGFNEREKNYVTCKIGVISNGIIFVCFVLFFLRGLL